MLVTMMNAMTPRKRGRTTREIGPTVEISITNGISVETRTADEVADNPTNVEFVTAQITSSANARTVSARLAVIRAMMVGRKNVPNTND